MRNICQNCVVESTKPFLTVSECFGKKQVNFCSADCAEEFIVSKKLQIEYYVTKRKLTQEEEEEQQQQQEQEIKKKKSHQNDVDMEDDDNDNNNDNDREDVIIQPEKIIIPKTVDKIVLTQLLGKGSFG
jgi:hypothetical protein